MHGVEASTLNRVKLAWLEIVRWVAKVNVCVNDRNARRGSVSP